MQLYLALLLSTLAPIAPIERQIPPVGIELTQEQRQEVELALAHLLERRKDDPERSDIAAVHKAVRFALENREFYDAEKDLRKIRELVALCDAPQRTRGMCIRSHCSDIDGSIQPYVVHVPEGLDTSEPMPVWIWLHGRGDHETDLHFLHRRLKPIGDFRPKDAIVVHPFGRQCIGWKHAGEVDVFEALEDAWNEFHFSPEQVALCGFSMGGAGAWHIGAHYADRFAAVHAGAGFAETARYIQLKKEDYPPTWEQKLWGLYDVPAYSRNLLNVPLIAYSGERDKQIQAARVMEEALAAHGQRLRHVIGPGMGHKYHPDSVPEIEGFVRAALKRGLNRAPERISLQTRTLRYPHMHWLGITGLEQHWKDSRVDARREGDAVHLSTKNVSSLWLSLKEAPALVHIDGQAIKTGEPANLSFEKHEGKWRPLQIRTRHPYIDKRHGLQGPIDDAFMSPFLVALPDKLPQSALHARWVEFELEHFKKRWRELFRGEVLMKPENELTQADFKRYHIIAWGTPDSSPLVEQAMKYAPEFVPEHQLLAMIKPNPENPAKYLVINSGPTFREAHDRTNSLQNPKLGDWAVIDLRTGPNAEAPGRIVRSGFFDERWHLPKS